MPKRLTLLSMLGLLLASGLTAAELMPGADEPSFGAVNRALEGHRATVELVGLEPIRGARDVTVGQDLTTWRVGSERQRIATTMVSRITIEKRSRARKWTKRGLWVGAAMGALEFGYSENDGAFVESPDASSIAKGALAGAAIGSVGGALAGDKVVFEADPEASDGG